MAGDIEKKQIQDELRAAAVSRRGFIDRIKGLGLGFGVAAALGVEGAAAHPASDAVELSSTNPALNDIINEAGKREAETGEKKIKEAWFRRFFYRRFFYARGYRRFFYRRW